MANTKSAKAKIREIKNKTDFNKSVKNRYRTFIKKVELNIDAGNKDDAKSALKKSCVKLPVTPSINVIEIKN